jgi:hypothetical protein
MPHLPREMRYLSTGDVVICYWGCIISVRDAHPSHPHPYLFAGDAAALTGDVGDLQNVGYVILLKNFDQ